MLSRHELWPIAIRTFLRQTYQDARLLIGIDARERKQAIPILGKLIDELLITGPSIDSQSIDILVVNRANQSLGAKRNALCQAAGPWIAFWDDDDWHHPERLEKTAQAIAGIEDDRLTEPSPILWRRPVLIGSKTMLIHEIIDPRRRTFTYRFEPMLPTERYFVGGLLCFEKRLWREHPFAEDGSGATVGDEAWWQLSLGDEVYRFEFSMDPTLYCAFRHNTNTANKQTPVGDKNWQPFERSTLDDLLGGELALWESAHRQMISDASVSLASVGPSSLVPT